MCFKALENSWNILQLLLEPKGRHLSTKKNLFPVSRCNAIITNKDLCLGKVGTKRKALRQSIFPNTKIGLLSCDKAMSLRHCLTTW